MNECGVANLAFATFAIGANIYLYNACHTGKHEHIHAIFRAVLNKSWSTISDELKTRMSLAVC